jgi:hypothetical protein
VQLNPRLTIPGAGLLRAFRQPIARATGEELVGGGAVAAARHIQLLLHGTPEQNVDSILATSLRGRPHCNTRWFSNSVDVASQYARGASRIIIFAVFKPVVQVYPGYWYVSPPDHPTIYTLTVDAHHVPLFVARR